MTEKTAPQVLMKADSASLSLSADKEGRIRINAGSFETPVIILPGQLLEVVWQAGQLHLVRRTLPTESNQGFTMTDDSLQEQTPAGLHLMIRDLAHGIGNEYRRAENVGKITLQRMLAELGNLVGALPKEAGEADSPAAPDLQKIVDGIRAEAAKMIGSAQSHCASVIEEVRAEAKKLVDQTKLDADKDVFDAQTAAVAATDEAAALRDELNATKAQLAAANAPAVAPEKTQPDSTPPVAATAEIGKPAEAAVDPNPAPISAGFVGMPVAAGVVAPDAAPGALQAPPVAPDAPSVAAAQDPALQEPAKD